MRPSATVKQKETREMPNKWVEPDDMESMAAQSYPPAIGWCRAGADHTFADCTEDHQFIHIDEEAAAKTPFGGTIAHDFSRLLLTKLSSENSIGVKGVSWSQLWHHVSLLGPGTSG